MPPSLHPPGPASLIRWISLIGPANADRAWLGISVAAQRATGRGPL